MSQASLADSCIDKRVLRKTRSPLFCDTNQPCCNAPHPSTASHGTVSGSCPQTICEILSRTTQACARPMQCTISTLVPVAACDLSDASTARDAFDS